MLLVVEIDFILSVVVNSILSHEAALPYLAAVNSIAGHLPITIARTVGIRLCWHMHATRYHLILWTTLLHWALLYPDWMQLCCTAVVNLTTSHL